MCMYKWVYVFAQRQIHVYYMYEIKIKVRLLPNDSCCGGGADEPGAGAGVREAGRVRG